MKKAIGVSAVILLMAVVLLATTIKPSYRATNTSITTTALNSLTASSSGSGWASAFVDNGTNLDIDEQIYVQVKTAAASTSASGYVAIMAYGCVGGTTTCSDAMSGSQGTATMTVPTNLQLLGNCNAVANATVYTCGPYSIANAFGGAVPARWGIAAQNFTGATLAATSNVAWYDSLQMTNQ